MKSITNNHSSLVPYNVSLGIQNKLVDLHLKDRTDKTLDSLLIVTHPPLYTLGTGVENLANLLPTLNSSSSSNDRIEIRNRDTEYPDVEASFHSQLLRLAVETHRM